jgi:glycosyltransferase EpsF
VPDTQTDLVAPFRQQPDDPVIIGSISTLTEQRGLTHLLDTAEIMQRKRVNCVLVIAGDDPLRPELEEKCERLGLQDRVLLTA